MITEKEFIKEIIKFHPQIQEIIMDEDWMGSINLQLGALRSYVETLIINENNLEANHILGFLDSKLSDANEILVNAIAVAFLEHVNDSVINLINTSYPSLAYTLKEITEFNNKTATDKDIQNFLDDL